MNTLPVFDAHFHIIDSRYPIQVNHGYIPSPFSCEQYQSRMRTYDVIGGAVVSGSFQGFDQSYLINALTELGDGFVGVTQLPIDVTNQELLSLNQQGIRAVRFNLVRGGSEDIKHLTTLAQRIYEIVGWHIELYVDSKDLAELKTTLVSLPCVSIDHLGLSKDGFSTLLSLMEQGVYVKATGFGRIDFDVKTALQSLMLANPNAIMFGTDLPSTRAPRPYLDEDIHHITENVSEDDAKKVLYQNAMALYKI